LIVGSRACGLLAALAALVVVSAAASADPPKSAALGTLFRHVADVPLGRTTSRVDYQSLDAPSGRLFVAGMGDGVLLVFDVKAARLVDRREGYSKITGVLAVPPLGKLYASVPGGGLGASIKQGLGMVGLSSGNGRIAVLDLGSLREIGRMRAGVFPDGIAYDPVEQRIFASDEMGEAITVFDARSNQVLSRIATGGEVGNVQYDPESRRIYAPIQTKNELVAIEPAGSRIVARFALPGGKHPHGLAIAPDAAIGYVACDADDVLLTVDLVVGRVIATAPLGRDPDVLALDPGLRRLYVASESGALSSFDLSNVRAPRPLGDVVAGPHAHSVAVDPVSHRLYLPLANLDGAAVMRILEPITP
jgi:DNA-binding beta-propeller fold protein YncE